MHLMDCQRGCGGTWAKIRRADRVVGVCRSTPDNDKEFRNLIRVDSACFSNVEVAVRRPPCSQISACTTTIHRHAGCNPATKARIACLRQYAVIRAGPSGQRTTSISFGSKFR